MFGERRKPENPVRAELRNTILDPQNIAEIEMEAIPHSWSACVPTSTQNWLLNACRT